MTIKELTPGQSFTFSTRKNAKRYTTGPRVGNGPAVVYLTNKDRVGEENVGKVLVILNNCRQILADPETPIFLL